MKRLYTLFALVAMLFASCDELGHETPQPGTPAPRLSVDIEGIITIVKQKKAAKV